MYSKIQRVLKGQKVCIAFNCCKVVNNIICWACAEVINVVSRNTYIIKHATILSGLNSSKL